MDQRTAFLELSALLTGIYKIAVDPAERMLSEPLADEYWRRLVAVFPEELPALMEAYRRVAHEAVTAETGYAVFQELRGQPEVTQHMFVVKQIVNIWYTCSS
jgi:hypothetical protein